MLWFGTMAHAQQITVTDQTNGKPLAFVAISKADNASAVVTDSLGKANITPFRGANVIHFQMAGYKPLTLSYATLEVQQFRVRLKPSVQWLDQVIVSSYKDNVKRETSLPIEPLSLQTIAQQGSFNLTDAMAQVPGVSQLTTGVGISKPVIRGLYGNRVLVLFSGLRFDNQQWQDEHGLGLSDIGIDRVEIIKGPLSLLYGTEAVGGVINIIEEQPPPVGTVQTDVGLEMHSNTGGGTLQAGIKANEGKKWYRIREAATNHADYSDGNGSRVLNSRFNGYYLKGSLGFHKKNWTSTNHFYSSYNKFGFIFSDILDFIEPDNRWSRSMAGPHHIVLLNMLSSVNKWQHENGWLKLNVGLQSNLRQEDEGAGEISLNMHLITGQYALKWSRNLSNNLQLVLANSSSIESNTNYGRRKIVPNASTLESSFSGYLEQNLGKVILEYGLGGGLRHVKTLPTPAVNSAEKEIAPFSQTRLFANGMLGMSFLPNNIWNVKFNIATGVRAPNLAELSSNGLHEGIFTYEVGDPDMDNERNINGDLGVYFSNGQWQWSISSFYNHFDGYIYLEPTQEDWFGFPVYRFRQHNANLYGGEASLSVIPKVWRGLKLSASYSGLIGKLDNGLYLPFMPAQQIKPEIRYTKHYTQNRNWYVFVNTAFVFAQNLVNPEETNTPGYELVNAGLGYAFQSKQAHYNLSISGNNLLNEAYYSHLSRFKRLGYLNMGRDISLNFTINFNNGLNKN